MGVCSVSYIATSKGEMFKFRMGLIEHLSQGLERKSSSMQKKEEERERQGERAGGRDREGKRKRRRKRREVGGREGSESTTKACVTSASEISCYRLSSAFLFFSRHPAPSLPSLSSPLLSLFTFTSTVYEGSPIVCRFAHNERTRVRVRKEDTSWN